MPQVLESCKQLLPIAFNCGLQYFRDGGWNESPDGEYDPGVEELARSCVYDDAARNEYPVYPPRVLARLKAVAKKNCRELLPELQKHPVLSTTRGGVEAPAVAVAPS